MSRAWNDEEAVSVVLSNFQKRALARVKKKKKNSSFPPFPLLLRDENKTEQRALFDQIFLSFSPLFSLSAWSKFVPRHVFHHHHNNECLRLILQIYIHTTYIYSCIIFQQSLLYARIYLLPLVRAHKQTQRWSRRSATAARR